MNITLTEPLWDFWSKPWVTLCYNNTCRYAILEWQYSNTSGSVMDHHIGWKDASWIMTTAVIILTMQTGFGLLEAGCVSPKNEVNIMVKNALDVIFGGVMYWACGFGLSFGSDSGSNPFIGFGYFFVDATEEHMGYVFAWFLFQLSFATTSTTIVSGAMAERTKLFAYIVFSMINTFIYCIPTHWVWAKNGFLRTLGAVDDAGCGPVHLVGGISGLVATIMLKPRIGRFDTKGGCHIGSPVKAILGMFMLWWGWLRFNAGSTFGVELYSKWKMAVRASVNTITSSLGGGITSVIYSLTCSYVFKQQKYDVMTLLNGILGSLVSVTAICTMCKPWEAFLIGCTGGVIASVFTILLEKLRIDDPVGVVPVHGACAIWGLLCVGLLIEPMAEDGKALAHVGGLLKGGGWYLLGIQALSVVIIVVWTAVTSALALLIIQKTIGLRLSMEDELLGGDIVEHGIMPESPSMWSEHPELQNFLAKTLESMPNVQERLRALIIEVLLNQDSLGDEIRSDGNVIVDMQVPSEECNHHPVDGLDPETVC